MCQLHLNPIARDSIVVFCHDISDKEKNRSLITLTNSNFFSLSLTEEQNKLGRLSTLNKFFKIDLSLGRANASERFMGRLFTLSTNI